MTDKQIIQGIRQGDEAAFRALVNHYQEMVINVSYRFVHSRDDAMDIAQEVFIKAYDSIGKFREQSSLSTWLYRIAVNRSLNFVRDKKRKNIFNSLDLLFENENSSPLQQEEDQNDTADEKMEKQENTRALYKALDDLPKKQRVAITLNKLEELTYKEIAEIMEISVSETGVLINRARKKLRKKLVSYFKNS
jgi:RNA polymerase sigma-70 factor (ECF subfamily)